MTQVKYPIYCIYFYTQNRVGVVLNKMQRNSHVVF